ncbi:PASTA domain-containing protein [Yinghuangia soli]|uniref:PASTA domain-containing protein n=1 Tax=Yinghuangia soli TaxID=2908204 RepID=A0AA41Q8H8_9ACTN|nr:PASTA domain-containing protein [Yinghuangia soli]MCF2533171.1 PASTA domain-containing protein [Yinghuangia soli]
MRLFCRLCGTRTDGQERLGTYCPGDRCGTDLRMANDTGVQAWCEPARQRGEPGRPATVRLIVRNGGSRPDTFRVEPVERVEGRLDFDASILNAPLAPDQTRIVEIRYTLPRDAAGLGIDVASRFGIPGADAAGQVNNGRSDRFGVALRVVSTSANQGAACAAFAVDVPARFRHDGNNSGPGSSRSWRSMKFLGKVAAAVVPVVAGGALAINLTINTGGGNADNAAGPATTPASAAPQAGTGGGDAGAEIVATKTSTGKSGNSGNGTSSGGGTKTTKAPTPETVMPDVIGLQQAEAEQKLEDRQFVVRVEIVPNSNSPKGTVTSASVRAGEVRPVGSTVTIRVQDGKVQVPDVTGMDEERARNTLANAGLDASFTTQRTSDSNQYKKVIRTDPSAGTSTSTETLVTVYLGTPDIR